MDEDRTVDDQGKGVVGGGGKGLGGVIGWLVWAWLDPAIRTPAIMTAQAIPARARAVRRGRTAASWVTTANSRFARGWAAAILRDGAILGIGFTMPKSSGGGISARRLVTQMQAGQPRQ